MFHGLYTAIITPFLDNGDFDENSFTKICEQQIKAGVDGIVVLGTTGESPTISHAEHEMIMQKAFDIIGGRTKLIAGAGSNCTREAIDLSKIAQRIGYDGILSVNPYYNKPTQEGMYQHFLAIADSINIGIILYNIKGRCGVNLETDTLLRLSRHKNIIGVKEASGDLEQIKEVINSVPDDFSVLSGDDNLTLEVMKMGGHGVVSVLSNALPKQMKDLVSALENKNWEKAQIIHDQLSDLFKDCFIETNPQPIKTLMTELGLCKANFRLPIIAMAKNNKEKLLASWKKYQKASLK